VAKKVDVKLYVRALTEIIKITGVCPNTLYGCDINKCKECGVEYFPDEIERELECWEKYLIMKLKEEKKVDNKTEKELPGIDK
jgi:hypothetical protein